MYSAGIEPVTLMTAELRSNCSPIEQTDIHCGKMPIHTTFSILMYSAGIEPVILVMAELRSSRSANETDGAYRKKGQYIQTLGGWGGRNSRG